MEKEVKVAVKAIRLARLATEAYIEYIEAGEGGPIDQTAKPELARIKAEVDVITAVLNEASGRVKDDGG